MAVEEARRFNPLDGQASQAFDVVNQLAKDATIESLQALSDDERRLVLGSYLKAGLAYFANQSGDEYLEELGTTAMKAIEDRRIDVAFIPGIHHFIDTVYSEPQSESLKRDFSDSEIIFQENERPLFLAQENDGRIWQGKAETGTLLVPVGFVLDAQHDPIKVLADIASLTSQMQDFLNGRTSEDISYLARVKRKATKAHFLYLVQGKDSRLEFSGTDRALLGQFPRDTLPQALTGLRKLQARK